MDRAGDVYVGEIPGIAEVWPGSGPGWASDSPGSLPGPADHFILFSSYLGDQGEGGRVGT